MFDTFEELAIAGAGYSAEAICQSTVFASIDDALEELRSHLEKVQ